MEHIFNEIREERTRQHEKWGEQNHKPIEWIGILTEEVGEVSKEASDHHFKLPKDFKDCNDEIQKERMVNYRKELIQVAAVAVQMIQCLERNYINQDRVYFRMQKNKGFDESVVSSKYKTDSEWDDYFEEQCGGVYKWWR